MVLSFSIHPSIVFPICVICLGMIFLSSSLGADMMIASFRLRFAVVDILGGRFIPTIFKEETEKMIIL